MSIEVVNLAELKYESETHGMRFERQVSDISDRLGTHRLGYTTIIVPPAKADAPYRFHLANEHVAVVLGGAIDIRLGGSEYPIVEGDFVAMPPRASSAFQLLNRSERPAHLLIGWTRRSRDVIGMPDSNKRIYRVRGGDDAAADVVLRGDEIVEPTTGEPLDESVGPAPPTPSNRDPRIGNIEDVAWEDFGRVPFRGQRRRLARAVGGENLGYSLYRLEPGQRPYPFHFHHVNEEFFYVRSGYGQLRTAEESRDIRPGDAFTCPPGPEGAHGILNTSDGVLEYFALSTMIEPEVTEYPDSDKTYIMVGSAPGGNPNERTVDLVVRRQDAVEYEEGER